MRWIFSIVFSISAVLLVEGCDPVDHEVKRDGSIDENETAEINERRYKALTISNENLVGGWCASWVNDGSVTQISRRRYDGQGLLLEEWWTAVDDGTLEGIPTTLPAKAMARALTYEHSLTVDSRGRITALVLKGPGTLGRTATIADDDGSTVSVVLGSREIPAYIVGFDPSGKVVSIRTQPTSLHAPLRSRKDPTCSSRRYLDGRLVEINWGCGEKADETTVRGYDAAGRLLTVVKTGSTDGPRLTILGYSSPVASTPVTIQEWQGGKLLSRGGFLWSCDGY